MGQEKETTHVIDAAQQKSTIQQSSTLSDNAQQSQAYWQRAEIKPVPAEVSTAFQAVVKARNFIVQGFILASAGREYYKSAVKNEKARQAQLKNILH